ncbi:hypothetical protein [Streptomyces poonensis]|uniref:Uncharacterized protein n=1 Tax=Streptomyces poonensis TaxID=68255 RepID=A0A918PHK1_9ACTN|nr:hypothetical protein [Streptomyces poonensis]GGZ10246.1 hypothetical protein GCM10010365_31820 [Streptomyces poonensis]GLJ91345.1 hypothetical protein GCM10017589_39520 [Streptomyces poonensis]
MRKRTLSVLCTLGALGGVLAVPAAAQAADPFPSGPSVRTSENAVFLDFGTRKLPKDLKVFLREPGTDTPVATITELDWADEGDDVDWDEPHVTVVRTSPLRLADLGRYAVDVEYDGTEGETILHKDEAVLDYRLIPLVKTFEVIGDPDLVNRTVTIKGDATLRDPRDDSETPMANGRLVLETTAAKTELTTDAAGHVETPYTFTGTEKEDKSTPSRDDFAVVLRPADEDAAHGLTRQVEVDKPWVTITLDSSTVRGADGTDVPLSGRATYRDHNGVSQPVPVGTLMSVYNVRKFYAGEDGRFTAQVPIYGTRQQAIAVHLTPWLPAAYARYTPDPTTSAGFHRIPDATVSRYKKVTVSSVLDSYDLPAKTTLKVKLQFKATGSKTWVTKKTVDSPAAKGDSSRKVKVADLPYPGEGVWRFQYSGTKKIPGGPAPESYTIVRDMTALPEFNASPEPVKKGASLTIAGKLNEKHWYDGQWGAFAGARVDIYFRAKGKTTWSKAGTAVTDKNGKFKRTFKAAKDGDWQARYDGDESQHFYSHSRKDYVDVK